MWPNDILWFPWDKITVFILQSLVFLLHLVFLPSQLTQYSSTYYYQNYCTESLLPLSWSATSAFSVIGDSFSPSFNSFSYISLSFENRTSISEPMKISY